MSAMSGPAVPARSAGRSLRSMSVAVKSSERSGRPVAGRLTPISSISGVPARSLFPSGRVRMYPWRLALAARPLLTRATDPTAPQQQQQLMDEAEVMGLTVPNLKEECKARNLPVSGRKADLQARLLGRAPAEGPPPGLYDGFTVAQLKEKLKERGLSMLTKKSDLVEKLLASDRGEITAETEAEARKEKMGGVKRGGGRRVKRDPSKPLILSAKTRNTKGMTKTQLKLLEEQQKAQAELLKAVEEKQDKVEAEAEEEAEDREAEQRGEVLLSKAKGKAPVGVAPELELESTKGSRPRKKQRDDLAEDDEQGVFGYWMFTLLDDNDEVLIAYNLKEQLKDMATMTSYQEEEDISCRVMAKRMRVVDSVTGKVKREMVSYPKGGMLLSCYMTEALFKSMQPMGLTWYWPKDSTWEAGKEKPNVPPPMSDEEVEAALAFLEQKEVEDKGPMDFGMAIDRMDMGYMRQVAVQDGRISRTAAKKSARRHLAELNVEYGLEIEPTAAAAAAAAAGDVSQSTGRFGKEDRREDADWGRQDSWGAGRGAGRGRGRDSDARVGRPQRTRWEEDDKRYGGDQDFGGRGGRQGGRGRGGRSQFSDRDRYQYNERNSWRDDGDDDGGQGWYSGGSQADDEDAAWARGSPAPAENFRVNGLTDDGRSTWVSHGNTWSAWDDFDDGGGTDDGPFGQQQGSGRGQQQQQQPQGRGGAQAWADDGFGNDSWGSLASDARSGGADGFGTSLGDEWLGSDSAQAGGAAAAGSAPSSSSSGGSLWDEFDLPPPASSVPNSSNSRGDRGDRRRLPADDLDDQLLDDPDDVGAFGSTAGQAAPLRGASIGFDDFGFDDPQPRRTSGSHRHQQQQQRSGGSAWNDDLDDFGFFDEPPASRRAGGGASRVDDVDFDPFGDEDEKASLAGKGGGGPKRSSRVAPQAFLQPSPGAQVDVVSGPFSSFGGKVLETRSNGNLQVRLDIFGRDTDVEVNAADIRPK